MQKVNGKVVTICFDSTGSNLWIGDDNGSISSFQFDAYTLKLNKSKKIVSNNGYCITSISYKNLNSKESALLVNAMPNFLLLYKLVNSDILSLRLRKRISIKQAENLVRSTFCPVISKQQQSSCIVCTGSEDSGVYIYDMDNDEKPLINKLQGHSSTVKDVALNYDQSLLASGDIQVNSIKFQIFYKFYNSKLFFPRALLLFGKQISNRNAVRILKPIKFFKLFFL